MSFKCSVFGHRYGDPEVEREREEQGSEVVITIKEIETCQRCGDERVVSENKEVTTLETPSDIVGDDIDGEEPAGEPATESEVTGTEPAATDGVAAEPDATVDGEAVETEDDAEFIDADEESDASEDREPGQWPDEGSDETGAPASETVDQPGPGGESADSDGPAPEDDDGVILDEDEEETEDDREPGQWPDDAEADDEEDDWAPSTDQDLRPVEEEQPDVEPTSSAVTVPEGEFYCPECDFTTDVESSSLRAGDFCPECHRGSLTHRTDE